MRGGDTDKNETLQKQSMQVYHAMNRSLSTLASQILELREGASQVSEEHDLSDIEISTDVEDADIDDASSDAQTEEKLLLRNTLEKIEDIARTIANKSIVEAILESTDTEYPNSIWKVEKSLRIQPRFPWDPHKQLKYSVEREIIYAIECFRGGVKHHDSVRYVISEPCNITGS